MGILETVLSQLPQADPVKPAGKEDKQAGNPAAAKAKAKVDDAAGGEKPASKKTDELELPAEEQPEEEPGSTGAKRTGNDYSPGFKERFGERA